MRMKLLAVAACLAAIPAAPGIVPAIAPASAQEAAASPTMAQVLADPRRAEDRARDAYRHPAETLAFFRVEPGMTVVDYMPAGGWFSRVLIPYLGPDGRYIGLNPDLSDDLTGYWDMYRGTRDKLPAQAREWVGGEGAEVIGSNVADLPADLNGTVDRVLIFREVHNMMRFGWLEPSLAAMHRLLKDDGLLGVEQHRSKPDAPADYTDGSKGYLNQEDVVALFARHGFELVGSSEINANPRDPADWPDGVWTLPPGYRGAGEDAARRAELDAIGESDRMTLLFRKVAR